MSFVFRILIRDSIVWNVLLVEQVDRVGPLDNADWKTLKSIISDKGIKIVSLDLPTSHRFIGSTDKFT